MCVLILFQNFSGINLIVIRIQQDNINVLSSSSKVSVILFRIQRNLNFLDRFSKNTQASISKKMHPVKPSFFVRTDRERERDVLKLIVAFRNFGNAPKIDSFWEIRRR